MLLYLNQSWDKHSKKILSVKKQETALNRMKSVIADGAGLRVRPVMMTAATVVVGLMPILFGSGTGSEVMSRIAAPMIGGMISSVLLTLLVLPVIYFLWKSNELNGFNEIKETFNKVESYFGRVLNRIFN